MLSTNQITQNWEQFLSFLQSQKERSKNPNRWEKLIQFYDKHANRFATIPASSKLSYHNAFPGGYIDHVLRVLGIAVSLAELWAKQKRQLNDFTDEELFFVALNHDLGKFGTEEHELYIPQDSDWHYKRGETYKNNPNISFMKISDRTLFLLQKLGVEISEKEYLAIKLHDGLYEESNKSYYIAYSEEYKLKTDLPYILHQSDLMAARIESKGPLMQSSEPTETPKKSKAISKFLNE